MKKLMTCLLASAAIVAAMPEAFAGNLGVIDAQQILYTSNAGKRLKASLEKAKENGEKKIADMEAKLAKQQEELMRKKSLLTEEKYLEEEATLKKAVRDYRVEAQGIQDSIDRELTIGRKEILDAIREAVNEISADRKFDLVMNNAQLMYHSDSVDITNDVLAKVNARLDKKSK